MTATLTAISPFFIVRDLKRALEFYRDDLGFAVTHTAPADEPFFATIRRDGAQFLLKSVDDVAATPNRLRHADARWDAFIHVPDPDSLATELEGRGVTFATPLTDTDDGLRGFEIEDRDGYVLFFGRPR